MNPRRWRRIVPVLVVFGVAVFYQLQERGAYELPVPAADSRADVETLFRNHESGVMVEIVGEVRRILADDLEGSRHQRFVLGLASGHTVLISHNIDLARRIDLGRGDRVEVRGQYEWNERGGVIHWTHHDPDGRRPGGWIRHHDRTYR